MGVNYGTNKVRFPPPYRSADRPLRATAQITGVEDVTGGCPGVRGLHRGARGRRQAGVRGRVGVALLPQRPHPPGGPLLLGPDHAQHEVGERADLVGRNRGPSTLNQRATSMQRESTASVVPGTSGTSKSPAATPSAMMPRTAASVGPSQRDDLRPRLGPEGFQLVLHDPRGGVLPGVPPHGRTARRR